MTSHGMTLTILARLPYLALVAVILLLDQWSKSVIHGSLKLGSSLPIVEGFLELTYVRNTGVAFGILSAVSFPAKAALLSTLALLMALLVVFYSVRAPSSQRLLQLALALILGGALGNLYDRVAHGYVIDFIHFHLSVHYWPAFNIADTAISVGVLCLAAEIIRDEIAARV